MTTAYLNRIATAVPEHDVHDAFVVFAEQMLAEPRLRTVFRRMVSRAGIEHRYSSLDPQKDLGQFWSHDAQEFYQAPGRRPTSTTNSSTKKTEFEKPKG
jgi:alpha-pyrone synthase